MNKIKFYYLIIYLCFFNFHLVSSKPHEPQFRISCALNKILSKISGFSREEPFNEVLDKFLVLPPRYVDDISTVLKIIGESAKILLTPFENSTDVSINL